MTTKNCGPTSAPSPIPTTATMIATPMTSRRYRRISYMMPQYSSAGIWPVFHRRPHSSQTHPSL